MAIHSCDTRTVRRETQRPADRPTASSAATPEWNRCGRSARGAAGLAAWLAIGLSGCTYRPIDDPKYGRLDERNVFERWMQPAEIGVSPTPMMKTDLEKALEAGRLATEDEQTLSALGATCSRDGQTLRCIYRKQVRYRAMIMPPKQTQYELEIFVAHDREKRRHLAVCYGRSDSQYNEPPPYFQTQTWRCSPTTVVATACKGRPRDFGIMDHTVWDCRP